MITDEIPFDTFNDDGDPNGSGVTHGDTFDTWRKKVNGIINRLSAQSSPYHFIDRKSLAGSYYAFYSNGSPTTIPSEMTLTSGDVSTTAINISSYVSTATTDMGSTPTNAVLELYSWCRSSPSGGHFSTVIVGNTSNIPTTHHGEFGTIETNGVPSGTHYSYCRATTGSGVRNDGSNGTSNTTQVVIPIGGSSGDEKVYYNFDTTSPHVPSWSNYRIDLVGFTV
jgi:hypothetical protein